MRVLVVAAPLLALVSIMSCPGQARIVTEPFIALKQGVNCDEVRNNEFLCLACNVYHESGNQTLTGKRAVAAVTMNRVKSRYFPKNICSVVWEPGEFSWTRDGKSDVTENPKWWLESLAVANQYLVDLRAGKIEDPTKCALFYHATYIKAPYWVAGDKMKTTATIGQHIFYQTPRLQCGI